MLSRCHVDEFDVSEGSYSDETFELRTPGIVEVAVLSLKAFPVNRLKKGWLPGMIPALIPDRAALNRMISTTITKWIVFNVFVLLMLAVDLLVFHRRSAKVSVRQALTWTFVWILLALVFNVGIWKYAGEERALEFLAGYLLEKSLSVDNLFVFLLVFSFFSVPPKLQHRCLFYGIIGALIMRAIFIVVGVQLLDAFSWLIYVFGAFLVFTGIKMAFHSSAEINPEKNPVIKLAKRFFKVTKEYEGDKFFVRRDGILMATPLFIVLLVVETTDVIFALDSIPAILAISRDPFIVYSSNVFAIMGLRALYFALAGIMEIFHFLHFGLSFILVFVGFKMVLHDELHIPIEIALSVVAYTIYTSIVLSIAFPTRDSRAVEFPQSELDTEAEK
ncbi:MAG: TerC family protein [Planctomycetota bacterium]|nr:TerC family protein [Planctomycetota bacterium]MDA1140284.1 TerC family protein [Planctomycetota bacterium]